MPSVGVGVGLVMIELHDSLPSTGDPQDEDRESSKNLIFSLQKHLPTIQSNLWLVIQRGGSQYYKFPTNFDGHLKEMGHFL